MPYLTGMNMKATATIIEIRGTYTANIECQDGTYIELLGKTPALDQDAAEAAIRRMAQLLELRITSITKARTPAMDAGRPSAFEDHTADLHEQAEREAQRLVTRNRIEQIRVKAHNRKAVDRWLSNQSKDAGGKAGAA